MEVEVVERLEAELDRVIERRAKEKADEGRIEEVWAESARRRQQRRQEENREAWCAFHQNMQALHDALAAEHRAKAEALLATERAAS